MSELPNLVLPGERVDDLQRNGLHIIQDPKGFCFGMDAVLLSGFVAERIGNAECDLAADLGTGTGIIPILLSARTRIRSLKALEIQEQVADMAGRSVRLNDLTERIEVIRGDMREASALLGRGCFDIITSNPPYMKQQKGLVNPTEPMAISRHEIHMSLEDLVRESSAMLKQGGRLFLVHRPLRLVEIFGLMTRYSIEPKTLRMVHPFAEKEATMVLIEARKGGGPELRTLPPLIIYREKGVYTREIMDIYGY